MPDSIEIGDKVDVNFDNVECIINAEVLGIPQATGDSWRLKLPSGDIAYVQMFCRMDKKSQSQTSSL